MSFLYSVKFDPAVLWLDREGANELQGYASALEVADSVLDVRHAFFQVRMIVVTCYFTAWRFRQYFWLYLKGG